MGDFNVISRILASSLGDFKGDYEFGWFACSLLDAKIFLGLITGISFSSSFLGYSSYFFEGGSSNLAIGIEIGVGDCFC